MPDENRPQSRDSDAQFIAGVATALPIGDLWGSITSAAVKANSQAAKAAAELLKDIAFDENGSVRMVNASMDVGDLHYEEQTALINYVNTRALEVKRCVSTVDIEITTSRTETSSLDGSAGGSADIKVGWGPVSAKMHVEGKFSSSKENTHKQDSSAKVHAEIEMGQAEVPIGIIKMQERLTKIQDAYTDKIMKDMAAQAEKDDGKAA